MFAVLKLLFKYQIKSWFSFLLCFILPFIFMFLCIAFANTIQQPNSSNGTFLALPGIIISIGPTIGILNLTLVLSDFKQSLFFKRLRSMPIKMLEFFYSIVLYHLIIILVESGLLIGFSSLIYYQEINFNWINWPWIFLTIVINSITSCLIGFLLNQWINDFKINLAIAVTFFLVTMFLSGCYLPLYSIKSSNILKYCALILPGTYASSLMIYGWYSFTPKYNGRELVSYKDYGIFNNYLIPLIIALIIMIVLFNLVFFQKQLKTLLYQIKNKFQGLNYEKRKKTI